MIDTLIIKNVICKEYHIKPCDLNKSCKKRCFVEPRQVFHYLVNSYNPKISFQKIASLTNHKNHSTIIHSIKTVQNLIDTNGIFKEKIQRIQSKISEYKIPEIDTIEKIKLDLISKVVKCNSVLSIKKTILNQLQSI